MIFLKRAVNAWRYRPVIIALVCAAALPSAGGAQAAPPPPATAVQQPDSASIQQSSNPLAEYRLPPEKLAKSEALYRSRVAVFAVGSVYGIAVLVLILLLRLSPRFRDLAERVSSRRFLQVLVFTPLMVLTIDGLNLPLEIYGQHLQLSYGLSVQGWGSWFWDWTKGEMVGLVIVTPILWGLYALLRRSPRRWWFYGWIASIPVVLLIVFIQPVFIDPLFNKFDPLEAKQPQLVPELEKVIARGGLSIPRSAMFEMQASDKVTTYNAYVTGIGASKRVVVWDNTSRDLTIPQTLFVFGHEQGHYVLHHIWLLVAFFIMTILLALYVAHRSIAGAIRRWGPRLGIRDVSDLASLPVFLLLFAALSLVGQPIGAAFSRSLEHQADIYGLEVIHGLVPDSPEVAAQTFQMLGEKALSYPTPNPFYAWWTYGHPPVGDRMRFAATYRPWDEGRTPRYVR